LHVPPLLWISVNERIQADMGLFATKKAFDRLEDRLRALENTCSDLARDSKRRELEGIELYDKVRHQMSRMAKRAALDAKDTAFAPDVVENGEDLPTTDPISAAIHARRNRGFLEQ